MNLKAIIHPAEEGGFWAEVPALPGCFTQGETMHELKQNIHDAIELWLSTANDFESDASSEIIEFAV